MVWVDYAALANCHVPLSIRLANRSAVSSVSPLKLPRSILGLRCYSYQRGSENSRAAAPVDIAGCIRNAHDDAGAATKRASNFNPVIDSPRRVRYAPGVKTQADKDIAPTTRSHGDPIMTGIPIRSTKNRSTSNTRTARPRFTQPYPTRQPQESGWSWRKRCGNPLEANSRCGFVASLNSTSCGKNLVV